MRILVVSNIYPPAAIGGYEIVCEAVVERLSRDHEVLVLTSAGEQRTRSAGGARLTADARGARRAPLASMRDAALARRALAWKPDFIYVWNGASIPQAALSIR